MSHQYCRFYGVLKYHEIWAGSMWLTLSIWLNCGPGFLIHDVHTNNEGCQHNGQYYICTSLGALLTKIDALMWPHLLVLWRQCGHIGAHRLKWEPPIVRFSMYSRAMILVTAPVYLLVYTDDIIILLFKNRNYIVIMCRYGIWYRRWRGFTRSCADQFFEALWICKQTLFAQVHNMA